MDKELLTMILHCFDNIEQMTKSKNWVADYNREQFINTACEIRKKYLDNK